MAHPGKTGPQYKNTEQVILNDSVDDKYGVLAVELTAENEAGTALLRPKVSGDGKLLIEGTVQTTAPEGGTTGTLSNVTMTGASVTLQASNTSRRNLMIFNDSGVTIYVKLGSTASSSSFTVKMVDQSYYELPTPVYTGIVTALGASGSVRVTEVA